MTETVFRPQPKLCEFFVEMALQFDLPFQDEAHAEGSRFTNTP